MLEQVLAIVEGLGLIDLGEVVTYLDEEEQIEAILSHQAYQEGEKNLFPSRCSYDHPGMRPIRAVGANSGGEFYDSYYMIQGIDTIAPVDVYMPGCPPRPETLIEEILKLRDPQGE